VWVYHLSEYTHWVHAYVGYTIYFTLFFQNQYTLIKCIFKERYVNLKKYTHFITLDISQKYPYSKLGMISNLGKFR
jgi:hypothetical protein